MGEIVCGGCDYDYDDELPPHPTGGHCGGSIDLRWNKDADELVKKWVEAWTGLSIELEIDWHE